MPAETATRLGDREKVNFRHFVNYESRDRRRMRWIQSDGFTLVELLIVLGIIAMLISMLMPALSAARQDAKTVQCLSNLRQMGQMAQMYVGENDGYYPPAKWNSLSWDFSRINGKIVPGFLWAGHGSGRVQQCPSFTGASNTADDPYTGYNYNISYIGHGTGEAIEAPAKASQIRHSSDVALFGDGQYAAGADKYMRAPVQESPLVTGDSVGYLTRLAGTQGYRHRGKTNVCYCDGHAASVSNRSTHTGPFTTAPNTGFLSDNNRIYGGR